MTKDDLQDAILVARLQADLRDAGIRVSDKRVARLMRAAAIDYTTIGPVRHGCGHAHHTVSTAARCLARDQRACKSQRGYSDRAIYEYARSGRNHVPERLTQSGGASIGGIIDPIGGRAYVVDLRRIIVGLDTGKEIVGLEYADTGEEVTCSA